MLQHIELQKLIVNVCRRLDVHAYAVGGTVRDRLLGRASHDWDFVCPNARRVALAVARKLSVKCITLDEQFRIYRVVPRDVEGGPLTLDFAELQGQTIQEDLARRDFTINAMAVPLQGASRQVIDPFSGQKDLKGGVLRAVSRQAFREDPLRLLRAYRLAAQFGFQIEARTGRWIASESGRLSERVREKEKPVARERVREELLRLLGEGSCASALRAMDASGMLTEILPDLEAGRRVGWDYYGKDGVVRHHLQSVANVEWLLERLDGENGRRGDKGKSHPPVAPSPRPPVLKFLSGPGILEQIREYLHRPIAGHPRAAYLKLAALLHDLGKPATAQVIRGRLRFFGHEDVGADLARKLLAHLRFSRQENSLSCSWVRNHMRLGNLASAPVLTAKAMARFFRDLGEDGVGMLIVSLGDHYCYLKSSLWGKGTDPVERTAQRLLEAFYTQRESVLPAKLIDGHQLMKSLRLKPGPVIGHLLDAVRDAQAEGSVRTVREALEMAKKLMKRKPSFRRKPSPTGDCPV